MHWATQLGPERWLMTALVRRCYRQMLIGGIPNDKSRMKCYGWCWMRSARSAERTRKISGTTIQMSSPGPGLHADAVLCIEMMFRQVDTDPTEAQVCVTARGPCFNDSFCSVCLTNFDVDLERWTPRTIGTACRPRWSSCLISWSNKRGALVLA